MEPQALPNSFTKTIFNLCTHLFNSLMHWFLYHRDLRLERFKGIIFALMEDLI